MAWLIAILALYVAVLAGVAWFSARPFRTPIFLSPGAMGVAQEEISLKTRDGVTLRGWWVDVPNAPVVAVIAHGYMMNRSELVPQAVWLAQRGIACLLLDLRAHGRSGGKMCGFGYLERADVRAGIDAARGRCPGAKVILLGSSMGSAASTFAAAEAPELVDGLVLDSAYSTLLSGMFGWWRFLGGPVLAVVLAPTVLLALPMLRVRPRKVDVASALATLKQPVLLLHGDADDLALPSEARRNEAAAHQSELVWLGGCGHSEGRWIHPDTYFEALDRFLARVRQAPAGAIKPQATNQ
ncbi:MAG: lysophospholipase [Fimbriimonadaceae bacterium]|nr:alpha/beta fold hydrolase [Chthonomonadaceae bacterium]MCO5296071.1 lysophospholipase [Fimbriimonadaceae bacterium]